MSNDRATRASRAAMSPDSGDGHADDFAEVIYSMICIAPTVSATLAPRNARQARQGRRFLRAELPRILATPPDVTIGSHGSGHQRSGRRLAPRLQITKWA